MWDAANSRKMGGWSSPGVDPLPVWSHQRVPATIENIDKINVSDPPGKSTKNPYENNRTLIILKPKSGICIKIIKKHKVFTIHRCRFTTLPKREIPVAFLNFRASGEIIKNTLYNQWNINDSDRQKWKSAPK